MSEKTESTLRVKVVASNHTHKGMPVKAGAQIEVTPAQAEWLARKGIIDKSGSKAAAAEEKK